MGKRRRSRRSVSWLLFKFDRPYLQRYGLIAGVDEAGRGPLAGPVVAAAVILPPNSRIPYLNDSKQLTAEKRLTLYQQIHQSAQAIGVGIVEHDEIDRLNIYHASFAAMRQALDRLTVRPRHVLVDGYRIPRGPESQTGVIGGDAKSACIAAASIIAKVTRDRLMKALDRHYPGYGFKQHKGYGTPAHLDSLRALGPCPIHRRTFAPVRRSLAGVSR
ncbi:MAG: ribonuclease HII [Elusimicrobiota bacterium]|jgi:ribonuclease HII